MKEILRETMCVQCLESEEPDEPYMCISGEEGCKAFQEALIAKMREVGK